MLNVVSLLINRCIYSAVQLEAIDLPGILPTDEEIRSSITGENQNHLNLEELDDNKEDNETESDSTEEEIGNDDHTENSKESVEQGNNKDRTTRSIRNKRQQLDSMAFLTR